MISRTNRHQGLSTGYVEKETGRAVAGVSSPSTESAAPVDALGTRKIWPGIDIDIPTSQGKKKTDPRGVRDALRAALLAGGVILTTSILRWVSPTGAVEEALLA